VNRNRGRERLEQIDSRKTPDCQRAQSRTRERKDGWLDSELLKVGCVECSGSLEPKGRKATREFIPIQPGYGRGDSGHNSRAAVGRAAGIFSQIRPILAPFSALRSGV